MREDGEDQDQVDPAVSAADEKQELEAAVEKICQLREIIRSLETELEDRKAAEKAESAEVEELRGVLAEALLGQQAVQEELELVRNNSTNQDVIDLVEGLKDQLNAKSQELTKHRAAAQHLHDVKVLSDLIIYLFSQFCLSNIFLSIHLFSIYVSIQIHLKNLPCVDHRL